MKKIVMILALLSFSTLLTACNTVSGMGKDIQSGGSHLDDAAKSVQQKM